MGAAETVEGEGPRIHRAGSVGRAVHDDAAEVAGILGARSPLASVFEQSRALLRGALLPDGFVADGLLRWPDRARSSLQKTGTLDRAALRPRLRRLLPRLFRAGQISPAA